METTEQTLLKYRHALRGILGRVGIGTNPAVTDDWILDQISTKITGRDVEWKRCEHCDATVPGQGALQIHVDSYHPEHANTRWHRG